MTLRTIIDKKSSSPLVERIFSFPHFLLAWHSYFTIMTKRQLKKAAYKHIIKDGQSHQEAFESLRTEAGVSATDLAEELSKLPSAARIAENMALRGVFIGTLALVMILRIIGVIGLGAEHGFNGPVLLLLVALGIVLPAIIIVLVLQNRVEAYRVFSLLALVGILRGLKDLDLADPWVWLALVPTFAGIVLGFWIPTRLKTPFTISVKVVTNETGNPAKVTTVVFEDGVRQKDELLDSI